MSRSTASTVDEAQRILRELFARGDTKPETLDLWLEAFAMARAIEQLIEDRVLSASGIEARRAFDILSQAHPEWFEGSS